MTGRSGEGRKQPRISICLPLEFACPAGSVDNNDSFSQATIFDLSVSGVSFYTNKPMCEGDKVDVLCKDLWKGKRTGTVRWCRQLQYNLFLVGIELEQELQT